MASIARKLLVLSAAMVALLSVPATAQDQDRNKDLATCGDLSKDADARLQACARSLDRDRSESLRRWATILIYRATAWRAKGNLDSALAAVSDAIAVDPDFAAAYNARADILSERGQCDNAIADYDRLIQLAPESAATAYVSRGGCFMQKGAYDPALESFDEAIRRDPKNVNGIGALASAMKGSVHSL
jgi:tetratricopeptide (TPR) repeat protein